MIRLSTLLYRSFCITVSFAVLNLSVPFGAMAMFGKDALVVHPKPAERIAKASRELTDSQMAKLSGRAGENPYLAGQNKWDIVYKGLNLMTGNYSTSATDLSYEGGYGIPVNVTRSYSSNSGDEGPLGPGWNLSVDVRSTAGGVLKSSKGPVMAVPTNFKERPTGDDDPRRPNDPVEAVIATDAGGTEETIQRDVDGVLTTPPWDKNVIDSEYELVTVSGNVYRILKKNVVKTIDGTVYEYVKHGTYTSGLTAHSGGTSGEPSNVLKIHTATDRQGNVTTYTYATTSPATFTKNNGSVSEDRLTSIEMPGGHKIQFVWTGSRITKAQDMSGTTVVREVTYGYTSGMLTSVTTPGGKVTSYGYGASQAESWYTGDVPGALLTSITDPRGLHTYMTYKVINQKVQPYGVSVWAPVCMRVKQEGGTTLYFSDSETGLYDSDWPSDLGESEFGFTQDWQEWAGTPGSGGIRVNSGGWLAEPSTDNLYFTIRMYDLFGADETGSVQENNYPTLWRKTYYVPTQDMDEEYHYIRPYVSGDLSTGRKLRSRGFGLQAVDTQSTYNFMGKPLKTVVREYEPTDVATWGTAIRTTTTAYAYWGKDKYYQQRAVMDNAGRISMTDYYDSSASAGSKGQTKAVYDPKHATYVRDDSGSIPSSPTSSDTSWKSHILPASTAVDSAHFTYDSKGRATEVYKLAPGGSSYVKTETSYGSDGAPVWGQAGMVVEDAGTGKTNRTTTNLSYTSYGKVTEVQDPLGRKFATSYDNDGVVQSVTRTDVSPNVTLVSYTYGTSGVLNGVPTAVTDGLSGVSLEMSYSSSTNSSTGEIIGQVKQVEQKTGGVSDYTASYKFHPTGDRASVTYTSPDGTSTWKYDDYVTVGDSSSPSRVFQTLVKLDSSSLRTKEELHYAFDAAGRLRETAFALSTGQSSRLSNGSYYDATHQPSSRARAFYDYDPAGRSASLEHYWDVWNSGTSAFGSEAIVANTSAYDTTKGLKTGESFYVRQSSGSPNWSLHHSNTYSYESSTDFLTGASYGDGQSNATPSWSYDHAGNRSNSGYTYDNLNRMTASPWASYSNDLVGNRSSETAGSLTTSYTWDVLNRMTARSNSLVSGAYVYRSDGLRVKKTVVNTSSTTVDHFRYDGQMPFEDEKLSGTTVNATREALGARGIDAEEAVTGTYNTSTGVRTLNTPTISFPLYDAHGNRMCSLSRSGTDYFTTDTVRYYGAWGDVRVGNTTGDSIWRYCASLGHVQDDESNLIYMRARYYEPSSGRFVSEDPGLFGTNWFVHCENDPISKVDVSGRNPMAEINFILMRIFQDLAKANSRDRIGRLGNAAIRSLMFQRDAQNAQAEDCYALAEIAAASGNAEGADALLSAGARHSAFAVAAELAILQVRAMMYMAEMMWDIPD